MGYYNFPSTRNYNSDLGWLIKRVKELSEQDESYINDITSPQNTLLINRVGRQYQLDVKATPEDVNKTYVDNADKHLQDQINTANSNISLNSNEIKQARTSYFGKTYDTLDERIDNDINDVLGKVNVMNYKGTSIYAENTLPRNLNVNGNKFEIYGKTKQNLFDNQISNGQIDIATGQFVAREDRRCSTNFTPVIPNQKYVVSVKKPKERIWLCGYDENKQPVFATSNDCTFFPPLNPEDDFIVVTIDSRVHFIKWYMLGTSDISNKMQIEQGTTPTPYTPFGLYTDNQVKVVEHNEDSTQTNRVVFDTPLRSAGDIKDKIDLTSGKWQLTKNVKELVLNGSEDWQYESSGKYFIADIIGNNYIVKEPLNSITAQYTSPKSYSEFLTTNKSIFVVGKTSTRLRIYIHDETYLTSTELKDHLSSNNVNVQFEHTPTTTEITPIEGNDIVSYNDTTYITTENKAQPTLDIDIPVNTDAPVTTITSDDGSIGITKVGDSVDLKVLLGPSGSVTKTYVDDQDNLVKEYVNTQDIKLNDKIDLKLDHGTYLEKMTLLDQMNAYQNEKLEKIEKISEALVTPDGWNDRTTYFSKDIFVEGITPSDQPVVNVKLTEVFETAMTELEEYNKIFSVISGSGKITLYATEPTTTQITLMLKGV